PFAGLHEWHPAAFALPVLFPAYQAASNLEAEQGDARTFQSAIRADVKLPVAAKWLRNCFADKSCLVKGAARRDLHRCARRISLIHTLHRDCPVFLLRGYEKQPRFPMAILSPWQHPETDPVFS